MSADDTANLVRALDALQKKAPDHSFHGSGITINLSEYGKNMPICDSFTILGEEWPEVSAVLQKCLITSLQFRKASLKAELNDIESLMDLNAIKGFEGRTHAENDAMKKRAERAEARRRRDCIERCPDCDEYRCECEEDDE